MFGFDDRPPVKAKTDLAILQDGKGVYRNTIDENQTHKVKLIIKENDRIIEKDMKYVRFVPNEENIAKYCNKGSQVAVDGRIQVRSYDGQDGTKKYVTEVVADNVTFLGSKNNNSGNDYTPNTSESDIVTTDVSEDPFKDFGSEEVLSDDDLPF